MDRIENLSPAKCILLAASLAASSNIRALQELTLGRSELFKLELICRLLLTFLPESVEPSSYVSFLGQIASPAEGENHVDGIEIDTSSVDELSEFEAQKHVRKLHLLPLKHRSIPEHATSDPLTLFLIHRAHRIDSDTGLLPIVPQLITPFLERSEYLRDWYIGTVVPFLRFEYEYYPPGYSSHSLDTFEELQVADGPHTLLSKTRQSVAQGDATSDTVGRDFRGILGPWVSAGLQLRGKKRKRDSPEGFIQQTGAPQSQDGVRPESVHSAQMAAWQSTNEWLVSAAVDDFPLAVNVVEGWNGPNDIDLGVSEELYEDYQMDNQAAEELHKGYYQTAFAAIYAVEQDTPETIDGAHKILVRLADLLGLDPPPDLAASVHMLPKLDLDGSILEATLISFLQPEALLRPDNPLTTPNLQTFSLLQMLVRSAYLLASLGQSLSVPRVAKLRFWSEDGEQLRFIQRILHNLVNGQRKDEQQWQSARETLLWLWDWGTAESTSISDEGYGVFRKVKRNLLEVELLRAFCRSGQYSLVTQTYIDGDLAALPLARDQVEEVIVAVALHFYDNASNGNRTRGGVKKASDIIAAFQPQFPESVAFSRCNSLISATHALSFYSLTLQRGVPFQPVSIRISEDPVGLIEKVLEQNAGSYTKLDDLIGIGRNLVKANSGLQQGTTISTISSSEESEASQLVTAERRVTSMAIESALSADDFETAYSYVVNRLSPPPIESDSAQISSSAPDDISWRAALNAGRHRSAINAQSKRNSTTTSPTVRRLEQRMELLSHALQLAPSHHLPEVLAAWRRVEEELLALLAQESAAEEEFDDKADKGEVRRAVPGSFGQQSDLGAPELVVQPRRKELGRGAAEEAPMGLFDVARGAAAAFSRSTSGSLGPGKTPIKSVSGASAGEDVEGRQRKRDMVANVVTGGLASGIGWVLGAKPIHDRQSE